MSEKQIQIIQVSEALSHNANALTIVRGIKAGGMPICGAVLKANAALGVAQRALGAILEVLLPLDDDEYDAEFE